MDATYRRWKPLDHKPSLDEVLDLLCPEGIDEAEGELRACLESYSCPLTVRNWDEFEDELFSFYAHYKKPFWGGFDLRNWPNNRVGDWSLNGLPEIRRVLGGPKGYVRAKSHAVRGTEGGFIAIIDKWKEWIVRGHIKYHLESIFETHVPYSDGWERWGFGGLGQELLDRYGKESFPEEERVFCPVAYRDVVELFCAFALHRRELRNQLRRVSVPAPDAGEES